MDERLRRLENQSVFIIRESYNQFKNMAVLWSVGKDSTTMLALIRKAFFGKIPFPVIHIDTGYKFKEMYEFRDKLAKEWGFDLMIATNNDSKATPSSGNKLACCTERKTEALKKLIKEHNFDAVIVGIRRDEHGIRNKEHYMSPRDKNFQWNVVKNKEIDVEGDSPYENLQEVELAGWGLFATQFKDADHVRVHPILHWNELDIWEYVKDQNLPAVSLYFAKDGKRYRSIGCSPCTQPIDSNADNIDKIIAELKTTKTGERDGRAQDKEDQYAMEKLRQLGYM